MDPLIPLHAGGTRSSENLVVACSGCAKTKGNCDWLCFGQGVDRQALLKQREASLLLGSQHVLPLSIKTTDKAMIVFRERWRAPRFKVVAALFENQGLIAWDTHSLPTQSNGAWRLVLKTKFGATVLFDGRVLVFSIPPDRFHEALWALIESNALIERVAFSGGRAMVEHYQVFPDVEPEHLGRWDVLLTGNRWLVEVGRVRQWGQHARKETKRLRPIWAAEKREAERRTLIERCKSRVVELLNEANEKPNGDI